MTSPHTVVSIEVATQNIFLNLERKSIFRLHVVRGWIIDIEDRITTHFDRGPPDEYSGQQ